MSESLKNHIEFVLNYPLLTGIRIIFLLQISSFLVNDFAHSQSSLLGQNMHILRNKMGMIVNINHNRYTMLIFKPVISGNIFFRSIDCYDSFMSGCMKLRVEVTRQHNCGLLNFFISIFVYKVSVVKNTKIIINSNY